MAEQKPFIFRSAVRAFFSSLFGVVGAVVGLAVALVLVGVLISGGKKEMEVAGSYQILPDANGKTGALAHSTPLILAIDVKGIIGTDDLSGDTIRKQLVRSQQGSLGDGRVRGVMLLMNTPGGSVFDSDTIYRLIEEYKQHYNVPVYVYTDGLCASGGMYIASAADKIFASDVSLIGSVGVMANFVNVSKALEKVGVEAKLVTRGTNKGALNPLVPWKEGDDRDISEIIEYFYGQFVDVVTRGRPRLGRDQLVNEYGARVFPAPQARSYGYIDSVENDRAAALKMLVEEAGIAEDEKYQVIQFEEKSWIDSILKGSWLGGEIRHSLDLPVKTNWPTGYLYLDATLSD